MFTRRTIHALAYSPRRENIEVDAAKLDEPTLAMVMAISAETGIEHHDVFPKSVNHERFIVFLERLRSVVGTDEVALFMDNLSVHKKDTVREAMTRLNMRPIYNLPYAPDYNPIELVFSKLKHGYKTIRL